MSLIYIIKNGEMIPYIGSTTKSLKIRLQYHNYKKKAYENNKCRLCASFILLNGNETIELLEECEIGEIRIREQHYIDTIPNCNIKAAYYTEEQKTEAVKETAKNYREANREKINESKKIYREANREKISEQRQKAYQANREKINEQRRKAYRAKKLLG